MSKNQSGFTIIEILLAIVILGLFGGVGWYALHAKKKPVKPAHTSVASPPEQSSQASDNPASTTQSPQPSYTPKPLITSFPISGWSVQFKVAEDLGKLTYQATGNNTVGFAYSDWEALDPNCAASKGGAGFLSRYDARSLSAEDSEAMQEQADAKVGNFYYVYEAPQSPCSTNQQIIDEQATTQPAVNLRNSIRTSLAPL